MKITVSLLARVRELAPLNEAIESAVVKRLNFRLDRRRIEGAHVQQRLHLRKVMRVSVADLLGVGRADEIAVADTCDHIASLGIHPHQLIESISGPGWGLGRPLCHVVTFARFK